MPRDPQSKYDKPRLWKQKPHIHSDKVELLSQQTGLSPLTVKVCLGRGLEEPDEIRDFLAPKLERLSDPFRIQDMDKAAQRLIQAKEVGEKVRIFGDYDVDGTTATALLCWFFRDCGFLYDATQPDRFKDGYGLNEKAVEQAASDGVKVLVTVDNGITCFEPAKRCKELGIDLVIVDHHQVDPDKGIPDAFAVVNPHRKDCTSGLTQLCGCGLAFYLTMAIRSIARGRSWFADQKGPNLKAHLDLVVMATAADMVPLSGDNRVLVRHGLEVLKTSTKPGVRALMEAAGIASRTLSPGHLGFVLGPRINASGRMASAGIALQLLVTRDQKEATEIAFELERLNADRMRIQNEIWDEVKERVKQGMDQGKYQHGIVVADPNWHEGVVGIVASRVTETFHRPAIVLSMNEEEGFAKGSVRSFGGVNVLEAVRENASLLIGFGGHRFAAGCSLSLDQVEAFSEGFDQAVAKSKLEPEKEEVSILNFEDEVSVGDLDPKTLLEIEALAPFGPANPEPLFRLKALPVERRILKDRHLKMSLVSEGQSIDAIWFHAAEKEESLQKRKEQSDWIGVPELNRFRGRVTPTFRVKDWKEDSHF